VEWFARAGARSGLWTGWRPGCRGRVRLSGSGQGVGSSWWGCQPGAGIAVIRSKAAAIWVAQGQV